MSTMRADLVVVGGGTAGCALAARLVADGDASVVVLEAGPDYGARGEGRWPADLLDGGALTASHDWGFTSGPLPGRESIAFQRARVISGCSAHNGAVAVVGCAEDYAAWAEVTGDPRWAPEAVRPVLQRVLERLHVRVYGPDELSPFHEAALGAAAELGWPRADDLHVLDGGIGYGVEPVNVRDGVRWNTAFAYLDDVRTRPGLTVVGDVLVDRIEVGRDGVTVKGVQGGEELSVAADRVVLSAGTFGTPAVLLRSGIGDPSDLARLGIPVVHALPGVGRNLHDHPMVELEFAGTPELTRMLDDARAQRFVPEEQTLGKLRSSLAAGPYDLHVMPVAAYAQSVLGGRTLIAAAALEPRSRGALELRSRDPAVLPVVEHAFLTDEGGHDLAVLREGVALARELAAAEPLRSLVGPETVPGGDDDLDQAIRRLVTHYFHPVGSCAMGRADDPAAVCDGAGRLHGLERVSVADCSLFPVVPRANTNVPAVLAGEIVANALLSS